MSPPITSVNISDIAQLDGNNSLFSSSFSSIFTDISEFDLSSLSHSVINMSENNSLEDSWFSQSDCDTAQSQLVSPLPIPVVISERTRKPTADRLPAVRRVLRRENKCIEALSLPIILSYNMRSIWGKLDSLALDMVERSGEICFLSEVWEKMENKKHKKRIEELLEIKNISYISTPRPGAKRGGGAAIATNTDRFSVTKLNIFIPKPLEIVWALMRPINPTGDVKKVILCSFYSPPNSRKNKHLIDHISITYNSLKIQHPEADFLMSGDKNDLDEKHILALNPNFRQIVSKNLLGHLSIRLVLVQHNDVSVLSLHIFNQTLCQQLLAFPHQLGPEVCQPFLHEHLRPLSMTLVSPDLHSIQHLICMNRVCLDEPYLRSRS